MTLVGVEIIDGALDESLQRLEELRDIVDIVKVRRPGQLAAVIGEVGRFRWLTRPASESRNPDELVRDVNEWTAWMLEHGESGRWFGCLLGNEPQHPESPYAGPDAGPRYVREVLRPALPRLDRIPTHVNRYWPPLVPYSGTANWTAAYESLHEDADGDQPALEPAGHCYQNNGDTSMAVAETLAMAGSWSPRHLVVDEVGDTSEDAYEVRVERVTDQFRRLADVGVAAAILFPLAGCGGGSCAFAVEDIRWILQAGQHVKPTPPKPIPVPRSKPVARKPIYRYGFKDFAKQHPEIGQPLINERRLVPGVAIQITEADDGTKGVLIYFDGDPAGVRFEPREMLR